ncbi:MAG: DUF885 domain-containing protein [Chitinophagaceae bacterium]|nr:DUF885 domain-containing protein [Chitinophagaceae bacterium]
MKRFLSIVLCVSFLVKSEAQKNDKPDLLAQSSELHHLMVNYEADKGSITRFYAAGLQSRGSQYHSPERRERLLQLIDSYLGKLKTLPFNDLSKPGQVDYILFKRNLDDERYRHQQDAKKYDRIKTYITFATAEKEWTSFRRRGLAVDGQTAARKMDSLRKLVQQSITSLKDKPDMDLEDARYAADAVRDIQFSLRSYFQFYNEYDPQFSWWVPATHRATDSVLSVYVKSLEGKGKADQKQKDDGSGIIGSPIGRDELIRQLQFEMIPYTPEELVEIANREFAWCDKELLKASREMGFGDNWKAAQEKVKNSYVQPGQQPAAMLDLYNQSVEFLKKYDLVTIPPIAEETWRVNMMSAERQLIAPFFLGGESLIISYPTAGMGYEDKLMSLRGNNPHFSRAVIHHELIAGHHLQGFMQNRYKAYRNFDTPFWVEGNALYWELILWDLGFNRSPEDKMGMLFWRMHRCARIIFSLNYHLNKWTPQQCIDFLVDRVGHERSTAEGEVRRSFTGGYGPLYQIAYMIGGLQFYALKKELVDTKKMTYKEYHDAILRENNIPIEMLRATLTNQPLSRDYKTGWRFRGSGDR